MSEGTNSSGCDASTSLFRYIRSQPPKAPTRSRRLANLQLEKHRHLLTFFFKLPGVCLLAVAKHTAIAVGTTVALVAAVLLLAAIGLLVKKFKSRAEKRHGQEAITVSVEPQSVNEHLSVCYENIAGVAAHALNQSECHSEQSTCANDVEHTDSTYQQVQFENSTEHDSHVYDVVQTRDVQPVDNQYQQVHVQNSTDRDSHTYDTVHA